MTQCVRCFNVPGRKSLWKILDSQDYEKYLETLSKAAKVTRKITWSPRTANRYNRACKRRDVF